jgi:hypothetical protein
LDDGGIDEELGKSRRSWWETHVGEIVAENWCQCPPDVVAEGCCDGFGGYIRHPVAFETSVSVIRMDGGFTDLDIPEHLL